jgi:hypothetical protein
MAMTTDYQEYGFGKDPIVIRKELDDIKGGAVLDVTGYTEEFIYAGHPVIRDVQTGKIYKPFPVADGALGALPEGYEYCGVVIKSKPTSEPFVSVLTIGEVNEKALKFPLTAAIKAAFKAAVPTIVWAHD